MNLRHRARSRGGSSDVESQKLHRSDRFYQIVVRYFRSLSPRQKIVFLVGSMLGAIFLFMALVSVSKNWNRGRWSNVERPEATLTDQKTLLQIAAHPLYPDCEGAVRWYIDQESSLSPFEAMLKVFHEGASYTPGQDGGPDGYKCPDPSLCKSDSPVTYAFRGSIDSAVCLPLSGNIGKHGFFCPEGYAISCPHDQLGQLVLETVMGGQPEICNKPVNRTLLEREEYRNAFNKQDTWLKLLPPQDFLCVKDTPKSNWAVEGIDEHSARALFENDWTDPAVDNIAGLCSAPVTYTGVQQHWKNPEAREEMFPLEPIKDHAGPREGRRSETASPKVTFVGPEGIMTSQQFTDNFGSISHATADSDSDACPSIPSEYADEFSTVKDGRLINIDGDKCQSEIVEYSTSWPPLWTPCRQFPCEIRHKDALDYVFVRCIPELLRNEYLSQASEESGYVLYDFHLLAETQADEGESQFDYNIVMLQLDGVSRRSMPRAFPRTFALLEHFGAKTDVESAHRSSHEAFHFTRYQTFGWNPFSNLAPLITGFDGDILKQANLWGRETTPSERHTLWNAFNSVNMTTFVSDDICPSTWGSTLAVTKGYKHIAPGVTEYDKLSHAEYNYTIDSAWCYGFRDLEGAHPALSLLSPNADGDRLNCLKGKPHYQYLLESVRTRLKHKGKRRKMGAFVRVTSTHDDSINAGAMIDNSIHNFILWLTRNEPETIFVLASDSGSSVSKFAASTPDGQLEARLPMLTMLFPVQIFDGIEHDIRQNLLVNQLRSVSTPDLHRTLKDLAALRTYDFGYAGDVYHMKNPTYSLIRQPVPNTRNICETFGHDMDVGVCLCPLWETIQSPELRPELVEFSRMIIKNEINERVKDTQFCNTLTLKSLETGLSRRFFAPFQEGILDVYRLQFTTSSGVGFDEALWEGQVVVWNPDTTIWSSPRHILHQSVRRRSFYGKSVEFLLAHEETLKLPRSLFDRCIFTFDNDMDIESSF